MSLSQSESSAPARLVGAVAALADWAAQLSWPGVAESARDRFALLLHDTLAVTWAGANLAENRALADAWPAAPGPATALGGPACAAERAAWLNGLAAVSLEMDCASRVTRGHAAAQSFFAVLAVAQERGSSAPDTLAALLVAHEVASRFGRASTLVPGLHPHGSWGTAGAAAGAAHVMGLGASGIARAIDIAGGLMLVSPFSAATSGNMVRNHWVGCTNTAGLIAARAAAAGPAEARTGPATDAYRSALGELDPVTLVDGLEHPYSRGDALALHTDFIKRHAACGYSHALLDAVLIARADPSWPADPGRIERILVETNETSAQLASGRWDSRLAAMFSIDYLVAAAAVLGDTGPRASDPDTRQNREVIDLVSRVVVEVASDLQARMPLDRAGRVTVQVAGRQPLVVEVPNARWDPRYHPATWDDVRTKARALLEPHGGNEPALHEWVQQAAGVADAALPDLAAVLGTTRPDPSPDPAFARGHA